MNQFRENFMSADFMTLILYDPYIPDFLVSLTLGLITVERLLISQKHGKANETAILQSD